MHDKAENYTKNPIFYLQQKYISLPYSAQTRFKHCNLIEIILTVYCVISYSLHQKYHFRSYTIRLLLHTITKRGQNDIRDMCNYSKARLDTTPKS